jgi:uncharacterized protein DUF6011
MTTSAPIKDPAHALRFLLAGNAHATFVSRKTETRFTYRVSLVDPRPGDTKAPPHFVSVLTGSEQYTYLGCIFGETVYSHGKRSKVSQDALSAKAFAWIWKHLSAGHLPPECEIWHDGRCSRCRRQLTVPESLASGLGPECARKMGNGGQLGLAGGLS